MPVITGGANGLGGARVFKGAGAPTVNVTLLGTAGVGDLYSNISAGALYICTATNGTSTIVWALV